MCLCVCVYSRTLFLVNLDAGQGHDAVDADAEEPTAPTIRADAIVYPTAEAAGSAAFLVFLLCFLQVWSRSLTRSPTLNCLVFSFRLQRDFCPVGTN